MALRRQRSSCALQNDLIKKFPGLRKQQKENSEINCTSTLHSPSFGGVGGGAWERNSGRARVDW